MRRSGRPTIEALHEVNLTPHMNPSPPSIGLRAVGAAKMSETAFESLRHVVGHHATLTDVLRWVTSRSRCATFAEVITQDEFTHDVIVKLDDGFHLVYDVSWLGAVTGTTLWDHPPDASELLDFRLGDGWRPTPTATVTGPVVLGHARAMADQLRP